MLKVSVEVLPMIWKEERLISAATTPEIRKHVAAEVDISPGRERG